MQNRRLSKNEQGIIGIIAVIAFVVGLVFLRDILVKRGVSILMLTREDYMNAVEYYMQKKYYMILYNIFHLGLRWNRCMQEQVSLEMRSRSTQE